jgi:hypothetical protein
MFSTVSPKMAQKFLNGVRKAYAEVGVANKQFTKIKF